MKCIVIDDEPLARQGMELLIKDIAALQLLGSFSGVVEATAFLQKTPVDLIFLDIEMPRISGINFLKNFASPPMVILTTAYPEYALEGFDLNVVDYLLKPIRFERFFKAVNKAQGMFDAGKAQQTGQLYTDADHVFVRADRKYIKLFLKDIGVIEGLKDYSIIHAGTEKIITAMNLKTIENHLPSDHFIRVNKSFIINSGKVQQVENDVIFVGDKQIPLGERYRQDFFDKVIKNKWIKR